MANFPTSLDNGTTLPNPTGASTLASPDHGALHTTENVAIIAVETKLGIGASTPTNNNFLVGTGTGTSAWTKAVPTGTVVGTSDSQTLTNKILTSPTINSPAITNATITADAITGFTTSNTGTIYGISVTTGTISGSALASTSVTNAKLASTAVNSAVVDWTTSGQVWWQELGRTTLGVAGNTITITSFTPRTYLRIIVNVLNNGGATTPNLRFNNDSGANYSFRFSMNGGADTATTATTALASGTGTSGGRSMRLFDVINVAANEKITYHRESHSSTAGAGTAPDRFELAGKWANTSVQINRVDVINGGAGNFGIGSEVIVLGHD